MLTQAFKLLLFLKNLISRFSLRIVSLNFHLLKNHLQIPPPPFFFIDFYCQLPVNPSMEIVLCLKLYPKVKCSRYRSGVAQRVGRVIALLFHDRGTRRGWVVSSTPRPHFTPGKGPVPIVQEAEWAPEPVWKGGKSHPHRDSIPDRSPLRQSLYRLSYPAHKLY